MIPINYYAGIIGNPNYDNTKFITDYLYQLKLASENNNKKLIVCLKAGNTGIENIVYKICKWVLGIDIIVFPTYHEKWNSDCIGNRIPKYMFNKKYDVRNYFRRDKKMVDFISVLIYFGDIDKKNEPIINMAEKKGLIILFEK